MDQGELDERARKTGITAIIIVFVVWVIVLFWVIRSSDPFNLSWTKMAIVLLCLIGTLFQLVAQQKPILRQTYNRQTWRPSWQLRPGLRTGDVMINATSTSVSWACFGAALALLVEHY